MALVVGVLTVWAALIIGPHDEANWRDMVTAPQWQPPFGWLSLTVAYPAVLLVAAVLLYRTMTAVSPGGPALSTTPTEDRASSPQRHAGL